MITQEHSSTSMAVKAVIVEIKSRLSKRFHFLPGMPSFFYDFSNGVSDQFKQYYAKIPIAKRDGSWICLAYSYESYEDSDVQPRNGMSYWRPVTNEVKRRININCAKLPLLCSILCNDSKTFNALHTFLQINFDWSFTTEYEDLLWPEWTPNKYMPLGWYIRPTEPNGKLYMCSQEGYSGDIEPQWPEDDTELIEDNSCSWTCIQPNKLKVKAGDFVVSKSLVSNPIEDGIMYQLDFGFTLHFVDYDDDGELLGVINTATLDLLNMYNPVYKLASIEVPEQS